MEIKIHGRFSLLITLLVGLFETSLSQQADSAQINVSLKEVVVSPKSDSTTTNRNHLEKMKIATIENIGSFNLSQSMTQLPGVYLLSTGVQNSKPVIRSLFGNRIVILINGLKFDAQQWQDEHALGLSYMGIDHIELIKGPQSVVYGSDAIGGVIKIIEETPAEPGKITYDTDIKFFSNTRGIMMQTGVKSNKGSKWSGIRFALEDHADFSDGKNNRVFNTRSKGYYLKMSKGFKKKNWTSLNNYHFSFNQMGFVLNDLLRFSTVDDRWSRKFTAPSHMVILNLLSSENHFNLKHSKLMLNFGIHSNYRAEDEGGNILALKMHLTTLQYHAQWIKSINDKRKITLSQFGMFQNNVNFGFRKIIPDARTFESNLSSAIFHHAKNFTLEFAAGGGIKWISTKNTAGINNKNDSITPFDQLRYFLYASAGIVLKICRYWKLKLLSATGTRIPNLAELSSNGLHEGIYTYEVGNPNLKNERNFNINLDISYRTKFFEFFSYSFYNYFHNYIYLSPTSKDWFGFPVFYYRQDNAMFRGNESGFSFKLKDKHVFSLIYAGLTARLEDGSYLPYMPAQQIKTKTSFNFSYSSKIKTSLFMEYKYVFSQNSVAKFENPTPGYDLFDAGIGIFYKCANTDW